ncbi:MAG: hypothetical protein GWN99_12955 [Gemmatimonadetes bacterium]|uniref:Uncharacterized protein n=1 Tax=Candidatus Kutchimonas denitrificans TaxID=3056748 RepID=A0AAE4ZAW9_9BACT|nr:hypothetical protein [Gemmatimonadota bacterium]NIR75787.1 hypothetical protein [Candidatus Kutchimonas denitrificans]NIS01955.1 hypothetical protein [Gemmatimonadota bacterium]NIT67759.1 hypothetical protein [Gemmatimonadota bacterium]NIU53746.1 hypothetical protein [Gemmatimonadota bacterium]
MPRLSRWFVRAALLHMTVGFIIGALLLVDKGLNLESGAWRTLPAHVEMLVLGWIVQLTMGVAFWILPRFPEGPKRGNVAAAWLAFVALNAGVLSVVAGTTLGPMPGYVLAGRSAEAIAAAAFVVHAWPRVKPFDVGNTGG